MLAEEERDRHKLDRKIEAEEHWMRYGVTRAAQAQRAPRRRPAGAAPEAAARRAAPPARSPCRPRRRNAPGTLVIEAKARSSKSRIGGATPIVADFSTRIERGDRIGIVGPNGSGKTTLVNLLTGALAPDAGTVRLGANLQMATLDQRRESLNPDWTVSEALTGGRGDTVIIGGQAKHVVGYMRDFLFAPEQARTPLRVLSGGERGRLMLARALAKPSNVLVLDEPTNDLDLETLDVLEEMIGDYAGTVLLISHDRDFLDRIVDGVIVPEGNGKWVEYAGGYTDMLAQRGEDLRRGGAQTDCKTGRAGEAQTRAPPPSRRRRKLSFNEKHALETLPGRMAVLEAEIGRLQKLMADPTLYARDRAAFDKISTASRPPRRNSPPRKSDGSSWSCCAGKSKARNTKARNIKERPTPFDGAAELRTVSGGKPRRDYYA